MYWKNLAAEVISSLLILLFVYTAISKLLDYQPFRMQLSKSPFITAYAVTISWALPLVEVLVAGLLLFNRTRILGLYTSLFLITMFTTYIYAMLQYSYDIPCSCGGVLAKMSWTQHLWFNIGFVVIAITGILLETARSGIKKPAPSQLPPIVYSTIS